MRNYHFCADALNLYRKSLLQQWGRLNLFNRGIQVLINRPEICPPHANLLREITPFEEMLTRSFNAQRGIVEETVDILQDGIRQAVAQVVPLPSMMLQNITGGSASAAVPAAGGTPGIPGAPGAAGVASLLNLDTILTQGRQLLDSVLASMGNAASQHAISGFSMMMNYVFIMFRDHIDPEHQHLLNTINPMIQRLQTARDQSSWTELTTALREAFRFIQEHQVYLQGLRLPLNPVRARSSAIPDFLQTISQHQNALQSPEQRAPQVITSSMIEQQETLLKAKCATYLPVMFVGEKICGLKGDEAFYAEIFKTSATSVDDPMTLFRERFFKAIDTADINGLKKWFAKRIFNLSISLSSFYVSSMLSGVLKAAHELFKPGAQQPREEFLVKLARNWLAVTSGAYNSVASMPATEARDFNAMMEQAIQDPKRNGGLKQNELFSAAAKTAIDAFGPKIRWNEKITRYFIASEIPVVSSMYFLNPVVRLLNRFCSLCLKSIVFVPQWIGNQILQGGAKLAVSYNPFIKTYSEQIMTSIRRDTPTSYAVQKMTYQQLQKILALLQSSLNAEPGSENDLLSRDSRVKKTEISGLVEYVLEVLNKSKYRTQDRLQNYLQGRAPILHKMGQELEEAALPEIMETAVTTISVAINALTTEEGMREVFYNSLGVAINTFDVQPPIPPQDHAAVSKGIEELTDQILESAIFNALEKVFDFTNTKQRNGINLFFRSLKNQTQTFANTIEQNAQEILQGAQVNSASKISDMVKESLEYHRRRVEELGKAEGNRFFHTETKYKLNELSKNMLPHCTALAEPLNRLKNLSDERTNQEKILHPILACHQINRSIHEKIQRTEFSSDDLAYCKVQIALMQTHLETLKQNRCPSAFTDLLGNQCQELTTSLETLDKLQKTKPLLFAVDSLIVKLKEEKLVRLGNSPSPLLRLSEKEMCNITKALPFEDQKELLNQKLLYLMLAHTEEGVREAAAQFRATYLQIVQKNDVDYVQYTLRLRATNDVSYTRLLQSIQESSSRYAQNKLAIEADLREVVTKSRQLNQFVQGQNEISLFNLFAFDMHWIQETTKNIAFNRAKAKCEELRRTMYQRPILIGALNQGLFSFLQGFGPQHLKIRT